MKQHEGLETQLFSWDGWDLIDTGDFSFYDVTLKIKIGDYEVGTKFDAVAFMTSTSKLEFYDKNGQVMSTHKLKITVE